MSKQVSNETSSEESIEISLKHAIKQRGILKGTVTRLKTFVNNFEIEDDKEKLEVRLQLLEDRLKEFENVQSFIEMNSEDSKDEENAVYRNNFEDTACDLKAKMITLLKNNGEKLQGIVASHTTSNSIQLPKIKLIQFNGDIKSWTSFKSLYDSLVHNNSSLSPSQKFQYLLSNLAPNILPMISNLKLDDQNYPIAYQTLVNRFSNPRLLAAYYFNEIHNYHTVDSKRTTVEGLQHFLSTHMNAFTALKELQNINIADFLEFSMALHNLDVHTRNGFENTLKPGELPTVDRLFDYITERLRSMEIRQIDEPSKNVNKPRNLIVNNSSSSNNQVAKNTSKTSFQNKPSTKCMMCSDNHFIGKCPRFSNLSVSGRYDRVKQLHLCYLCLQPHRRIDCKSESRCFCGSKRHHPLLHYKDESRSTTGNQLQSSETITCQNTILFNNLDSTPSTLLATALVNVRDNYNNVNTIRAIVDSGSEVNTITEDAVFKLHLRVNKTTTTIVGFGTTSTNAVGTVQIRIASRHDPNFVLVISAYVVKNITSNLPSGNIAQLPCGHIARNALADPHFNLSKPVDLLLGCTVYAQILPEFGNIVPGRPYAMYTRLGWILFGELNSFSGSPKTSLLTSVDKIGDVLLKFWESEEIPQKRHENPEDILCEKIYNSTTTRISSGRYEVALPFRDDQLRPSFNTTKTQRKYLNLEKRMLQNESRRQQYTDFMEDYKQLQHMSLAPSPASYIIPHHCVLRSSSKLRVVFNASDPDENGVSLNDCLLQGRKLQQDLPSIILNCRLHNILICTDIRMMFRQILIRPQDQKYQHILYRKTVNEPIQEYALNTVTYGLNCSPFLSQRTLLQLVEDEGKEFPQAADIIKTCTYVDDIVFGCDSVKEAEHLSAQLIDFLKKGGFELRKWSSNKAEILLRFPSDHLENPHAFDNDNATVKILGLQWLPSTDTFTYSVVPFNGVPSKRTILSYLARTYDAIGLVSPVTLWMKIFLQKLWLAKLNWDSTLPEPLLKEWNCFVQSFTLLSTITIPRQVSEQSAIKHILGFCDASEKGYAACVYLHSTYSNGDVTLQLLTSKGKVAPLSTLTIPKLELLAALLLARLVNSVTASLKFTNLGSIRLFSDSKTALTWLLTPPYRLKIYVANRVSKILELTSPEMWNYIPTASNPSDIASRGCSSDTLINSDLWWHGPKEFHSSYENWPELKTFEPLMKVPELKPNDVTVLTINKTSDYLLTCLERHSTYLRAICVFAYVLRFIRLCRKETTSSISLSSTEIEEANKLCVKLTQQCHWSDQKIFETPKSNFLSLSVFIDEWGLYRVGGRVRRSELTYDARHPLLLPKKSHLTNLICDHFHKIALHAGPRTTQALILKKYWIISLRSILRQRIHKCIRCYRFQGKPLQPPMADLPSCRITESRPFSSVGIDYAGYFTTKASPLRTTKTFRGYLCIFVCMATKACHLEYVSNLSTACFLASFDRFVSRRGIPKHVYSDNGTNFVGASHQLRETYEMLCTSKEEIFSTFAKKGIEWHFNPPAAPNFGGLWEAAVKSTKTILKRVIGNTILTFEEYSTLFCKIEAILNSRPLLDFSPDPNEQINALSPGHFLIGTELVSLPENDYQNTTNLKCKWKRLQQLAQQFWKLWSTEYIHTQMQRTKWQKMCPSVEPGQLVYIKGQNSTPLEWPLGRIKSLLPGKDAIPRIAIVETATGNLTRPVNKLIPLPIDSPDPVSYDY
jgi:hypothetical protein